MCNSKMLTTERGRVESRERNRVLVLALPCHGIGISTESSISYIVHR